GVVHSSGRLEVPSPVVGRRWDLRGRFHAPKKLLHSVRRSVPLESGTAHPSGALRRSVRRPGRVARQPVARGCSHQLPFPPEAHSRPKEPLRGAPLCAAPPPSPARPVHPSPVTSPVLLGGTPHVTVCRS